MMNRFSKFRHFTQRWLSSPQPRRQGRRHDGFERRRLGRICGVESLESRQLLTWSVNASNGLLTISQVASPGDQGGTGVLKVDPATGNLLFDYNNSGNFGLTGLNLNTLAGPIQINAGQVVNSNFIVDNRDGAFLMPTSFSPNFGNPSANPPVPPTPTINYSGGTGINQNNSLTVLGQAGVADKFQIDNATFNAGLLSLLQPQNPITLQQNRLLVSYTNLSGNLNLDGVDGGQDTLTIDATKGDRWDFNGTVIQGPNFQYLPPVPGTPPPTVTAGIINVNHLSGMTINAPFNGNTTPTVVVVDQAAAPLTINQGDIDIFNLNQPLVQPVTLNGFNGTAATSVVYVNGSAGNDNIYADYRTIALDANPADRIQSGAPFAHAGADITYSGVLTLNLAGMGGDNTFTVQAPPVLQAPFISKALPATIVVYGSNSPISSAAAVGTNLLRVLGNDPTTNSNGADTIKVGDFGTGAIQMVNLAGVVIYGLGGNNDLENLSAGNPALGIPAVPGLLVGGSGNDTLVGGAGGDVLLGGGGMNTLTDKGLINTTSYLLPHQDQNGNIFDPYLQFPTPNVNNTASTLTTGNGNDVVVTGARQAVTFGDPGDIDTYTAKAGTGVLQLLSTVDPLNPTSSLYEVTPALLALEQAFGISNGQLPANEAAILEYGRSRNLRSQFATFGAFVGRAYDQFLVDRKGGLGTSGVVSTGEIAYWVGQAQLGLTVQQMQAQLLASDELRNTARLTNAWFRGMYESVLGRLPTPAETSAYLAPLELNDTAAGRYLAAMQLLTSPAGTLAEIDSIYTQLVPNGTPSPVDIQAIEADLASGMRLEQVAQIVSASNGNYFNYAITNHVGEVGFIGGLYQSVLGRSASGGDLQFWSTVHANGASNQQIAMFILNSPEHRASVIQGFYQTYLHRGIDPSGLNFWLSVMAAGATDEQVLGAIVGSNEYYITNGGTSDSFVRAMYRDVLHRTTPPSQPEIDYWIATLAASTRGATQARADVVVGFATSDEFRASEINGWYQAYLGRPASAAEINNWLLFFHLGNTTEAVQAQILLGRSGM
jgi:Ca2+-binding RTX toxin-like protein